MVDATLLENIYFALAQADRSLTLRGKISNILTAASLLEALIEKEDITGPIEIHFVEFKDKKGDMGLERIRKGLTSVKLDTKEDIITFIEEILIERLILIASLRHTALLDKVMEPGYRPQQGLGSSLKWDLGGMYYFSHVEEVKSLLLKLLVALDLANVSLVDIAQKLGNKGRENRVT